jgi:putative nucleotidyltransferase with HDIG domain
MSSPHTRAELLVAEAEDIPTLQEVNWKVLKTISGNGGNGASLEHLISRDQAMTARILRAANSTFIDAAKPVASLRNAISVLGGRRLRSLALAASIDGVVRSRSLKNRQIWEHALAVALAASSLAQDCGYSDPEMAFTCGLMHDVGKMVLDGGLTTEYQRVLDLVYNERKSFVEAETEIMGFDHTEIGRMVSRKWNLPPLIEEVAGAHHNLKAAVLDPRLCAIISLADGVCVKQGIGPLKRPELKLSSLEACKILGVGSVTLEGLTAALGDRFRDNKRLFGMN